MNTAKKIIINLCRLVLALIFIFSGYVKAIDPLGTQYKIRDYLSAAGLEGIMPDWSTLTLSVLLSAVEFSLGIFILFAIHRRTTSKITTVFMVIMTLITLWLAIYNPIRDCGCFGDAIKLTNMQTLAKNVILLCCSLTIMKWPMMMPLSISKSNQWIVINYTVLFIFISSIWSLYYLPQFDFRPYHIGANIPKGMIIPEGAEQPEFETTFVLEKNGEKKEFTLDNYPDSTWTFVDSKTTQISEGYVPPIHDFSITLNEEDITSKVLSNKGYSFLLISPHLEFADDSNFGDIDQIYEYAQDQNIPFYCLTASGEKAISRWQEITGAEYPFCATDETTLRTIIRSNPGLLLLKNGTIINKWSHNGLPKKEELVGDIATSSIGKMPVDSVPKKILVIVLWFVLPLLVLTIADRTWAWSKKVRAFNQRHLRQLEAELNLPTSKNKKETETNISTLKSKQNEKENCSR